MFLLILTIKTDTLSYRPALTGRLLPFLGAFLSPFYRWNAVSDVVQATHSASPVWLPVWREVLGDILKPAVLLYFGFYFKNYLERRASFKTRKRDAVQMTFLCGLFFAMVAPWYVFLVALAGCVLIYFWEMRPSDAMNGFRRYRKLTDAPCHLTSFPVRRIKRAAGSGGARGDLGQLAPRKKLLKSW